MSNDWLFLAKKKTGCSTYSNGQTHKLNVRFLQARIPELFIFASFSHHFTFSFHLQFTFDSPSIHFRFHISQPLFWYGSMLCPAQCHVTSFKKKKNDRYFKITHRILPSTRSPIKKKKEQEKPVSL